MCGKKSKRAGFEQCSLTFFKSLSKHRNTLRRTWSTVSDVWCAHCGPGRPPVLWGTMLWESRTHLLMIRFSPDPNNILQCDELIVSNGPTVCLVMRDRVVVAFTPHVRIPPVLCLAGLQTTFSHKDTHLMRLKPCSVGSASIVPCFHWAVRFDTVRYGSRFHHQKVGQGLH